MLLRRLLPLLLLCLSFYACREEGVITTTTTEEPPPPTVVTTTVTAVTVDRAGNPLGNATITGITADGRRHPDGSITINGSQLSSEGTPVTVTSPGHWPEHRLLMPAGDGELRETFVLEPKVKAGEISPGAGGTIELGRGFSVTLEANTRATLENGDTYDGPVEVYVNHDAPEDFNEMLNSAGNFLALTEDGQQMALETYGMMDIALETPNGDPVVLDDETPAEVKMPIKAATQAIAPDEVPFWILDPAGFWLPAGFARLAPDCYIVYITSSATCNIDVPHPVTRVCGRFLDAGGFPLPHSPFAVQVANGMVCGSARVDCDGNFCINVAADVPLIMELQDPCSDESFLIAIDPVDANTSRDLGDIVIDLANPAFYANVVDCGGSGLPDIGATEIWVGGNGGNDGEYFAPRTDGTTVVSVVDCSGDDILVQAFTKDYRASSPVYRRDAEDYTQQEFVVCGDLGPDEYFTLSIDGTDVPITELAPIYWPDNENFNWLVRAAGDLNGETYSLFLQFTEPQTGDFAKADATAAVYRLAPGQDYGEGRVYVDPTQELVLKGISVAEEGSLFEGSFTVPMNLQNDVSQSVEGVNLPVTVTFRISL